MPGPEADPAQPGEDRLAFFPCPCCRSSARSLIAGVSSGKPLEECPLPVECPRNALHTLGTVEPLPGPTTTGLTFLQRGRRESFSYFSFDTECLQIFSQVPFINIISELKKKFVF